MLFSASPRGGSVLGVVVSLMILGAVAIGIDDIHVARLESSSQTAAIFSTYSCTTSNVNTNSDCESINGKPAFKGVSLNSDEYKEITCNIGSDFIIRINTDGSDGKIYYADANGEPAAHAQSQCEAESSELWRGKPPRQCVSDPAQQNSNRWKCYVKVCFRSNQSAAGKDGVGCGPYRTDEPTEVGVRIASGAGEVVTKASRPTKPEDLPRLINNSNNPLEQAQLKAQQLATGNISSETSTGIAQAFTEQDITQQHEAFAQAQTTLSVEKLALEQCQSSAQGTIDPSMFCAEQLTSVSRAEERLSKEQIRLGEMQGYAQSLGVHTSSFVPTTLPAAQTPPSSNPSIDEFGCDRRLDPVSYRICRNSGQSINVGPSGGYSSFGPGRQGVTVGTGYAAYPGYSVAQQDNYCIPTYNPQIVEQRPAVPGCLNYRSGFTAQQQCATTGASGWINIGLSVLSTLTGGRGLNQQNCIRSTNTATNAGVDANGVPLPSCSINPSQTQVQVGGTPVTLSWQSQNAFAATLSSSGGVGVNGSVTVQPQQTTTYTLSLQGYRNTQTGQVLSGQCSTQVVVGSAGTTTNGGPTAQIACSPQSADVGMSVAVSYACLNSNTSSGSGFSTNNQLSGSATPIVENPSIGSDSITYGLTCSKEGVTDTAQCTVRVNKTALVLVAYPNRIRHNEEVNIGWVTAGMQACTISSPELAGFTSDNAGGTSVSGTVRTPPLTTDARFVLTCTSRSGATRVAETSVDVD